MKVMIMLLRPIFRQSLQLAGDFPQPARQFIPILPRPDFLNPNLGAVSQIRFRRRF